MAAESMERTCAAIDEHLTTEETFDDWVKVDLHVSSHDLSTSKKTVVPAGHGHAFAVRAGERFRIVDLHGEQIVDFMAWVPSHLSLSRYSLREKMSMSYTRYKLSGATPAVKEHLYTNFNAPLFRLTADTVKVHDMTFMACNPEMYEEEGKPGHRSCATNIAEAMRAFGYKDFDYIDVTDPFNVFMNSPHYALKALNSSKPGDYVEFEALKDAVCAVSSCPFERNGVNGGKSTDVAVVTGIKQE